MPKKPSNTSVEWGGLFETPLGPIQFNITHDKGKTHIAARRFMAGGGAPAPAAAEIAAAKAMAQEQLVAERDRHLDELNRINGLLKLLDEDKQP